MEPLAVLKHLSNVLTTHEWQAFKGTEDYLWLVSRAEGYKGAAWEQLVKEGTQRRQEAWAIAVDMARSIIEQEVAELGVDTPEEQKQGLMIRLAERLLIEQDLTPATFTAWTDCDYCGRVPVPEGTAETVAVCPWCEND